jgi:hypothetical protein
MIVRVTPQEGPTAIDIGRRQFISVLGGLAALAGEAAMILWPTRVFAQRTGEIPRIALLWIGEEADPESRKFVAEADVTSL